MLNAGDDRASEDLRAGAPTPRMAAGDEHSRFLSALRIGRTKTYEEINAGRLKARKAGRRTIIADDDAEEWLSNLPALHEELDDAGS